MALNKTSLARLQGLHPHLIAIVMAAAEDKSVSFQVTEGVRTLSRQKALKAAGASTTLNSRHIPAPDGLAYAVDVVLFINGKVTWQLAAYVKLSEVVKAAAKRLGYPVEWGGDWKTFKDGCHFQLPWAQYPGAGNGVAGAAPPPVAELLTLRMGASGDAVMALQVALNTKGASPALIVDGDFGMKTHNAVKVFQTAKKLRVDGIVGSSTRKALGL